MAMEGGYFFLLYKENHRRCAGGSKKAFAMPSPAAAESLPLMREVAKIYLIFDGGRENVDTFCFLSPSHAVRVTAPSSEGAFKAVR